MIRRALGDESGRDRAVLIATGWDSHWHTDQYFEGHPFLTADAAEHLVEEQPRLVGIDSLNIDDIGNLARPVHTQLLGAVIPICRAPLLFDGASCRWVQFLSRSSESAWDGHVSGSCVRVTRRLNHLA
jgi:hypothetical protein